jgi:hypothetical protein
MSMKAADYVIYTRIFQKLSYVSSCDDMYNNIPLVLMIMTD